MFLASRRLVPIKILINVYMSSMLVPDGVRAVRVAALFSQTTHARLSWVKPSLVCHFILYLFMGSSDLLFARCQDPE